MLKLKQASYFLVGLLLAVGLAYANPATEGAAGDMEVVVNGHSLGTFGPAELKQGVKALI